MSKLTNLQQHYARRAREIASRIGINPDIFTALIYSESSFRPDALGPKLPDGTRAAGIAQFLPETARHFNIDPFNPEQSLIAAARYLKELYQRFGTYEEAIAAYKGFKDRQSRAAKESFDAILGSLFGGVRQFRDIAKELVKPTIPKERPPIAKVIDRTKEELLRLFILVIGGATIVIALWVSAYAR